MGMLEKEELAIYGAARALVSWHARHRFCAQCGSPTESVRGGWQRNCRSESCNAQHFPRTDPVAIMLVEHDGDLLLGRQPRFPARRFSALAGFIEPGETIEEAVAREVREEAGVRVGEVRYVRSQPWPFPSSLMIGCHAMALTREITIDTHELEEARWFTRAEVAQAMAEATSGPGAGASGVAPGGVSASFLAPPPNALAWHLLDWWLGER
jgi:NAD+ diphosphatase